MEPWDPFLQGAKHVQQLPKETLALGAGAVTVRPFVLPHYSKLDPDTHARAAGPRGWNHQQGFYVYRARRLLVAGDWLGLPVQAEEHYKLARIRVDRRALGASGAARRGRTTRGGARRRVRLHEPSE